MRRIWSFHTGALLGLIAALGTLAMVPRPAWAEVAPVPASAATAQPANGLSNATDVTSASVAPAGGASMPAQASDSAPAAAPAMPTPATLAELVAATPLPTAPSDDIKCLATATYFEAGRQSPAGALAVARVIVARTRSGRFPTSYCGVVLQPSQFSFARHRRLPDLPATNQGWQTALKIAMIADAGTWQSPVEGALFFHAAHVTRRMGTARMALVDGNVFYR